MKLDISNKRDKRKKVQKNRWQKERPVVLCSTLLLSTAKHKQNARTKLWKKLKKLLTNRKACDNIKKLLGKRQQQRTLITEQWNNLEKILKELILRNWPLKTVKGKDSQVSYLDRIKHFIREFDPGSGWTLAACLTHASRTKHPWLRLRWIDWMTEWRTGE